MAIIKTLSEGDIDFAPTYKLDKHSSEYDTSKKHRSPAYCDRILFCAFDRIKIVEYQSAPKINFSDHRPVYANF
jgi:hypothetical protein